MRSLLFYALLSVRLLALSAATAAQTTDTSPQGKPIAPIEVFEEPTIKSSVAPDYPGDMRSRGKEGWVNVSLMVAPNGRPYELIVTDSSGDTSFEKEVLAAMSKWEFLPATLNGNPIDSGLEIPIWFKFTDPDVGARPTFEMHYRELNAAIKANNKVKADAELSKLQAYNLFEDAHLGLAQYTYASKWGTEAEQLAGLNRAIAHEHRPTYLLKDQLISALIAILPLQLRAQQFEDAMQTWGKLQKLGTDEKTLATFRPIIAKFDALRTDDRTFSVAGELKGGSWYYRMFKKAFRIVVSDGHVSQVKLRCDKKFVSFQFDPSLQYKVADQYGKCSIQLLGDPGTKFQFIQS